MSEKHSHLTPIYQTNDSRHQDTKTRSFFIKFFSLCLRGFVAIFDLSGLGPNCHLVVAIPPLRIC